MKDDLLFVADYSGIVHCIDAKSGKCHWTHDLLSAAWSTPLIAGRHVYVVDESGNVIVFAFSMDPAVSLPSGKPVGVGLLTNQGYAMPVIAKNVLYVTAGDSVYAIGKP